MDLPFEWLRERERDDHALVHAWVADVPDPANIHAVLQWLKRSGLDALAHLKRIRRQDARFTLLLDTSADPPALPPELPLDRPYLTPVPRSPARTPSSLALKNAHWPTAFCPKRKWEPEPWTHPHVRWASDAVRRLKSAYAEVSPNELPVVAHVPIPFQDDGEQISRPFFGYDARTSTRHPLRHAVLDVIRQVADDRAQRSERNGKNGSQYLLTGLSLFITHEPCLMCTMALLHSRVKDVFYLVPMSQTGGCGGVACVPTLKGVNHRFSIAVWKEDHDDWPGPLDPGIDV